MRAAKSSVMAATYPGPERDLAQELLEGFLVQEIHLQRDGLVVFAGPRALPHHDVIGLLGHARGDLAPALLDRLLGLVAREARQRPGDDEGLPEQRTLTAFG